MTSQRGWMFQNSEILLSEKIFWTKVIVVPDFNIFTASYIWYTNLSLFEPILRWWHHKFQDFERIVYLTSKFLLLLILIFLSPLVHELQVRALFWANFDVIALNQNFKILREWLHKQKIHHKVPFTFDFHLSFSIGIYMKYQFGPFD